MLKLILILIPIYSFAFFKASYKDSRTSFLKYAPALKKLNSRFESGRLIIARDLTLDYFYLPAKTKKKLVIITSGTHGPEGFAGSALQLQFLDKTISEIDQSTSGILLIHAHNPWGFKHVVRGTQNNVNLNRNYDLDASLFQTKNISYEKIKHLLELDGKAKSFSFPFVPLIGEMLFSKGVTLQSLTEAIGKGQYTSKKGINFGGRRFEPQVLFLTDLLNNVTPPYSQIFNIDLHTGLGEKGVLHIMSKDNMNQKSHAKFKRIFLDSEKEFYSHTPPGAKGFYEIKGDYSKLVSLINPQKEKVIINITAEFGTVGKGLYGKVKTINALILENQGRFNGYNSLEDEKKIKRNYKEIFYPDDSDWEKDVLTKGHHLLDTVVKRFLKTE